MVSITISLEVMSSVRAQQNETFRGRHEIQGRDTTPVKINGSKSVSLFDEVCHNQPAKMITTIAFRNILELF